MRKKTEHKTRLDNEAIVAYYLENGCNIRGVSRKFRISWQRAKSVLNSEEGKDLVSKIKESNSLLRASITAQTIKNLYKTFDPSKLTQAQILDALIKLLHQSPETVTAMYQQNINNIPANSLNQPIDPEDLKAYKEIVDDE